MDDMRKARHDLRQHLAVVQSYIEKDDRAGLRSYISLYRRELPPDVMELYCRNDVVNAIICYYASLSRDSHIRFDAKADYPDACSISETDITVLLGNILETAVEACQSQKGDQDFIKLRIRRHGGSELLILADNTCSIPVTFINDVPVSSKREGMGIGTASMRDIAERYHGTVRFEWKEGVFYTSVLMQYQQQEKEKK